MHRGRINFPWRRRWWLTLAILFWCAGAATYIIIHGAPEDRLRETALNGVFLLAGSVAGAYLGFATWDDTNARRHMRPRRREPDDTTPEPDGDPEN